MGAEIIAIIGLGIAVGGACIGLLKMVWNGSARTTRIETKLEQVDVERIIRLETKVESMPDSERVSKLEEKVDAVDARHLENELWRKQHAEESKEVLRMLAELCTDMRTVKEDIRELRDDLKAHIADRVLHN